MSTGTIIGLWVYALVGIAVAQDMFVDRPEKEIGRIPRKALPICYIFTALIGIPLLLAKALYSILRRD